MSGPNATSFLLYRAKRDGRNRLWPMPHERPGAAFLKFILKIYG